MTTPYFNLFIRETFKRNTGETATRWYHAFGDYDRDTVVFEMNDCRLGLGIRRVDMKIVKTGDDQSDIEDALERINAR